MVLSALRGGVGFLTRLPVGRTEGDWDAFRARPYVFPLVAYGIGATLALAFVLPVPGATMALLYVVGVVALTGINHLDGVADLGDGLVVHGDPERRRAVMRDTTLGVGGTVTLVLVVLGLGLGGRVLAHLPTVAVVGLVVAVEVGAKLAMATVACIGSHAHDGLGAQVTGGDRTDTVAALIVAVPAGAFAWPGGAAALGSALVVAVGLRTVADRRLGGVTGDVFGAANELARVVAIHVGVVAWTLS